jgi:Protein of unknown function (DUF1573)
VNRLRFLQTAVVLLALASPRQGRAENEPAMKVEATRFDFGSVVFGQRISHAFTLRNQGSSPLIVQEVVSRCDCFHADFDKTIAPGQAGRIQTAIDTTDLQGPVFLTVLVRTNDPHHPTAPLEIKGFVNGPVMLLPQDHLNLTAIQGEPKEQVVTLEINRKRPLNVKGVDSTSAAFVPLLETTTPGRRYRIVVRADANQPVGVHSGTVRIRTDDKQPVIPIDCTILILSSVVVEPSALYLPPLDQQEARKGTGKTNWKVALKNVRNRPFVIVGVSSDLPFIHAWSEARPAATSQEVLVAIGQNDFLKPGKTISKVHVKTSLPDAQNVEIPVWVEVR